MVYKIVKYDLIGATLYTKKECPNITAKDGKFYEDGEEAFKSRLWEYTENPNKAAYSADSEFLPYFADVTEDMCFKNHPPKTYKNCQLMTEKHGGYLQFYHKQTKRVLRIAINSHYYTPIK